MKKLYVCTLVVAVVRQEEAILFIDQPKLTPEAAKVSPLLSATHAFPQRPQPIFVPASPPLLQHLSSAHVTLRGYDEILSFLSTSLPQDELVMVDPNLVSVALVSLLRPEVRQPSLLPPRHPVPPSLTPSARVSLLCAPSV